MFVNETRGGLGRIGFLALQHHHYARRYSLDMRASVWGCRVLDHEIGEGELGHFVWDEAAVGDMIGSLHWPSSGSANVTGETSGRSTGAWSWVFPAVLNPEGGGGRPFGEVTPGARTPTGGPETIPVATPGPGVYLGNGEWSEGTTVAMMRAVGQVYRDKFGRVTPAVPLDQIGGARSAIGGDAWHPAWVGGAAVGANVAVEGGGVAGPFGFGSTEGIAVVGGAASNRAPVLNENGEPVYIKDEDGNLKLDGMGNPIPLYKHWWESDSPTVPFGFGPALYPDFPGLFAEAPKVVGGLFGIKLKPSFPVFLPGFLPQGKKKPKGKTPTQTASWISDFGDIDEEEEGAVRRDGPIYPIRDENWEADPRFSAIDSPGHPDWQRFPRGYTGVVVQATEEDRQVAQFHPTDPRLVAPNVYGDPRAGTFVAEPNAEGELDGTRQAHLQSMMRVVPDPKGIGKVGENALSWNIGKTPRRETNGGLVTDVSGHGHMGYQGGGPMLTGFGRCPHVIGKDADGVTIRSGHLSVQSLFIDSSGRRDAPLAFEPVYEDGDDLDFPVRVHLGYDSGSRHPWLGGDRPGLWRWWTTSQFETVPPTITPEDLPPPEDTPPAPPTIPTPTGGDGFTPTGGSDGSIRDLFARDPLFAQGHSHTVQATASPGMLAKPQRAQSGAGDVSLSRAALSEYRTTTPLTGRIEAFGAQGGTAGGPYAEDIPDPAGWAYTYRPGDGRSPTGTAPGGWVVLPPEVGLESVDEDFAPAHVDRSAVVFMAGPGAVLGCGTPELATGGVASGATLEAADNDFTVRRYDGSGDETAESGKRMLDFAEIVHDGSELDTPDLNDLSTTTKQKQIGVVDDGIESKIVANLSGSIGKIGFGACAGFAAIYSDGGTTGQNITAGIPQECDQWLSDFGSERRATADQANNRITLTDAGIWLLMFSAQVVTDTANVLVSIEIRADDVLNSIPMGVGEASVKTANDQIDVSCVALHSASAGDEISAYIDVDVSAEVQFHHAQLVAVRIG